MSKIAIFASGNGTNAQTIIEFFQKNPQIADVKAVLTNNTKALVIQKAKKLGVDTMIFDPKEFRENQNKVIELLDQKNIDTVVLAGYMLLIPKSIIQKYKGKIINIHPALLPKFGGKGMYGDNVHKAVIQQKEKESGITIHHVSEQYDEGAIIFQAKTKVEENDTPQTLAQKIHALEHKHFPQVIAKLITEQK